MGIKCQKCEVINFTTEIICRRCGAPISLATAPPVNQVGLWRDANFLVMGDDVDLPKRCMKCNSSGGITFTSFELSYYPKYNLILMLTGFVTYRKYRVPVVLCQAHLSNAGTTMKASVLFIILGIIAAIYGSISYSGILIVGGGIIAVAGILLSLGSPSFSIERRDQSFIWMKGVNEQYLAMLPHWTKRT